MIFPFGGNIVDQILHSFEHYSRFFKLVVSFQKAKYSTRNSFLKIVLQCFHFMKRLKFRISARFQFSMKHFVTISSLKIFTYGKFLRALFFVCHLTSIDSMALSLCIQNFQRDQISA